LSPTLASPDTERPILIVDDQDDVREALEVLVRTEGFAARTACNGLEALREMRREPVPCVVLLDLHMPVMNGFGFRAEQERHPDLMAIPVVLYSSRHDIKAAANQLGIEAFLRAPFEIAEILILVSRYASCHPAADGAPNR
jgi:CheY-like chemotaxis protein